MKIKDFYNLVSIIVNLCKMSNVHLKGCDGNIQIFYKEKSVGGFKFNADDKTVKLFLKFDGEELKITL